MNVNYYRLINKMVANFWLKEKMEAGDDKLRHAFGRPFITIAREPGSGGAPIAKLLAERLNFDLINEQIIDEVSKSTQKRRAIIKEIDEKKRNQIDNIIHSLLNPEYVDDMTYIKELVKVVLAHASKGRCIILGRGANFICPFARGLHVNIVSPYDIRIQRAIDFEGFSAKQAKQVISATEKERREFVKQYFNKDVNDSNAYDLTVNTAYYDLPEAVDIIVKAFKIKFNFLERNRTWFNS